MVGGLRVASCERLDLICDNDLKGSSMLGMDIRPPIMEKDAHQEG